MPYSKFLSTFRVPFLMHQLHRNQYKTQLALERIQTKRLQRLIHHAFYYVPYYHHSFKKAGIRPDDVKSIADLNKLPQVSKADFFENREQFISKTANEAGCKVFTTSGTTGIPLRIMKDQTAEAIGYALPYYWFFESGLNIFDTFLEISLAFPFVHSSQFRHGPCGLLKGHYLSVFNTTQTNADQLLKIKPDVVYSFPSTLECMLNDHGEKLNGLRPKLVFTQGELLTDRCRQLIYQIFQVEPHNTYGSREFAGIAFECNEHSGLHVINDWTILELTRNGQSVGPNEEGETILTSLSNFAMPLIRYELGDLALWAKDNCGCGRNWPLIKELRGRTNSTLLLPSGRRVIGEGVCRLIRDLENIKRFQIVQRSRSDVLIKVVPRSKLTDTTSHNAAEKEIINRISFACLNENFNIQVEFVDSIFPQKSGKTPNFIREDF